MGTPTYWLDLFTGTTWQEFLKSGSKVSGFRAGRWKTVQQIQPGDYLLCYLTGVSRWIAALEVESGAFRDTAPIWSGEEFPCRLNVKVAIALTPETAVPVHELRDRLSMFRDMKSPIAWSGHFRGSPKKLKEADGQVVLNALADAQANPVVRPIDSAKLARRPTGLPTRAGTVTVPDAVEELTPSTQPVERAKEATAHTEIQWRLLKLGNDMGLDVWVARNDRGRDFNGRRFADLPHLRQSLPLQFDEATNRTIQLIDVLWLQGNTIVAAFEIESTTSIYSGLLRMSDLIAMQPNLNIPLYLVAPEDRRSQVITEVNRPTFSRLSPPMADMCRFIPFFALREGIPAPNLVRHLKPAFLEELSESCEIEDA